MQQHNLPRRKAEAADKAKFDIDYLQLCGFLFLILQAINMYCVVNKRSDYVLTILNLRFKRTLQRALLYMRSSEFTQ